MYEEQVKRILPWAMLGMLTPMELGPQRTVPVEPNVVDKPNQKLILASAEAKRQRKKKKRLEQMK